MSRKWKAIGSLGLAGALIASCSTGGVQAEQSPRELNGYAGLLLGSTFDKAMLVASPSDFNPYGLKECLEDLPIRGCFLSPENELTIFRRVQGIPYGLQLEFNKLDALTDITLKFVRRRTYDEDLNPVPTTIKKSECSDILERTIDWVAAEYGSIAVVRPKAAEMRAAKTAKGNAYWMDSSADGSGYVAIGEAPMKSGRSVKLFGYFLILDGDPDCSISVSFNDADKVVRRIDNPQDSE